MANSLEVPEAGNDTSEIRVLSDKDLAINNYQSIKEYSTEKINISLPDKNLIIVGSDMTIGYINDKYIQIVGTIISMTFEGCE